jgi:hypothetical protein
VLTPDGQAWLLETILGASSPALIRVLGTGGETDEAPVNDGFPMIEEGEIVFEATFGGEAANFDWAKTEVVVGDRVIDSNEDDGGTKVAGSEWTVRPRVGFAALTPSAG